MVDKLFLISITNSSQNVCLWDINFRAIVSRRVNFLNNNNLAGCENLKNAWNISGNAWIIISMQFVRIY